MTEEQFKKRSFKHSMPYDYVSEITGTRHPCLLLGVDFDKGCLLLWPLSNTEYIVNNGNEFWVRYDLCELPIPTLKAIK